MNPALTAENRPACAPLGSVFSTRGESRATHEDKGYVQVLIILPRMIPVKLSRFPTVHGVEIGARVIGPQWIEEFCKGEMKAVLRGYCWHSRCYQTKGYTNLGRAGRSRVHVLAMLLDVPLGVEAGDVPSLAMMGDPKGTILSA